MWNLAIVSCADVTRWILTCECLELSKKETGRNIWFAACAAYGAEKVDPQAYVKRYVPSFWCMYFLNVRISCIIHYNVCRYDGRYNLHKRALTVRKKIFKMSALERNSRFLPKDALPAGTHVVSRKCKSRDEDTDEATRFVKALESAKNVNTSKFKFCTLGSSYLVNSL